MAGLQEYMISLTAASVLCGILSTIINNTRSKNLIRFIFGVFLTVAVLKPIAQIDIDDIAVLPERSTANTEDLIFNGENMASDAVGQIIKASAEAYILDEAAALDAAITARVILNEAQPPVPVAAYIYGETTPLVRKQLQNIIQSELGIRKERQYWNGSQ